MTTVFFDDVELLGMLSLPTVQALRDTFDIAQAGESVTLRDRVDQLELDLAALTIRVALLELRMAAVELRLDLVEARLDYIEGLTVVTAIDHTVNNTVTGNQTIICTANVTVTLALAPNDRDKVTVVSNGNAVDINGNSRVINGTSILKLRKGIKIGLDMEYSSVADAWFIV